MSSSRPREKVAAAFRRLFGSASDKSRAAQVSGQGNNDVESVASGDVVGPATGHGGSKKSLNQGSPAQSARRLLARHGCRGAVTRVKISRVSHRVRFSISSSDVSMRDSPIVFRDPGIQVTFLPKLPAYISSVGGSSGC